MGASQKCSTSSSQSQLESFSENDGGRADGGVDLDARSALLDYSWRAEMILTMMIARMIQLEIAAVVTTATSTMTMDNKNKSNNSNKNAKMPIKNPKIIIATTNNSKDKIHTQQEHPFDLKSNHQSI